MAGQVALGNELLIGLDHDPARHAELRRQGAGGGQRRIGRQPPGPDGGAELLLELAVEGSRAVVTQGDEQLAGPELLHRTGSYSSTR